MRPDFILCLASIPHVPNPACRFYWWFHGETEELVPSLKLQENVIKWLSGLILCPESSPKLFSSTQQNKALRWLNPTFLEDSSATICYKSGTVLGGGREDSVCVQVCLSSYSSDKNRSLAGDRKKGADQNRVPFCVMTAKTTFQWFLPPLPFSTFSYQIWPSEILRSPQIFFNNFHGQTHLFGWACGPFGQTHSFYSFICHASPAVLEYFVFLQVCFSVCLMWSSFSYSDLWLKPNTSSEKPSLTATHFSWPVYNLSTQTHIELAT